MIGILNPMIPHYREDFFRGIKEKIDTEVFIFFDNNRIEKLNFQKGNLISTHVKSVSLGPILIYDFRKLLKSDIKVLVLMLNFSQISTWLLLIFKPFHRKKIILWGQGISIKRYIKEETKPNFLLKWMLQLSDSAWFYTENELEIWKNHIPVSTFTYLNNTISDVAKICHLKCQDISFLKKKYNIIQERILIFCARFNETERRTDLLINIIKELDCSKFGFIIIGEGKLKPDFQGFSNVYDFGSLYDLETKKDLFQIADIYFQPAWLGLSVVEALAFGKPIFTFSRSNAIKQGVEYGYITHNFNGMIFTEFQHFTETVSNLSQSEIDRLSLNAKKFAIDNLKLDFMISQALSSINKVLCLMIVFITFI
ncbi:glycosyltransferase [Salmonirosea aquatica]|uniref:Glycosyltransferase n=1 Tax=Salmonirosea aquatica TaxID=2654236 RepID=A0A7C9F4I5_9BACT|nr:glycosyltransferase [Cytophagaceae bacterium SJW1-29]